MTKYSSSAPDVEARRSGIHGKGVYAVKRLPGRRKIGEVTGELVPLPQAREAVEANPRIYLVELSFRRALDCSRGNVFKHLNHSCRPNCYLRIIADRVEVYTLRPIDPGTELTVDYGVTPHVNGMRCRCGNTKCRGRI